VNLDIRHSRATLLYIYPSARFSSEIEFLSLQSSD
jgi:hypothetical protein